MEIPKYIPVEGHSNLYRDKDSHAIINMNSNAANRARELRERQLKKENEYEELKSEVNELKTLLHKVLERI